MKSISKSKQANKMIQNQPQIQKLKYINWKEITQISQSLNLNKQSDNIPASISLNQYNNKTSKIISQLLNQNSELRKQIYHLDHKIALIKLDFENKELEYKNNIREYKKMINTLLYKMGYHTLENGQSNSEEILNKSLSNWKNKREHLYAKYDEKYISEESISEDLSYKSHFTGKQSFNLKGKSQTLGCQIQQNINPQDNSEQELEYVEQVSKKFQRQNFVLKPSEYLNFNVRPLQKQENKDYLQSLSSITDILRPESQQIQKQTHTFTHKQVTIPKIVSQKPKAQTERTQKQPQPKKPQSVRINTQVIYQNQSFKKIIQSGSKNRQRINQLLKNKIK